MEDGVTEGEGMIPSLNFIAEDGSEEEGKKSGFFSSQRIEAKKEEEARGGGGLITNLISTIATPLSLRTGEVKTEEENRNGVSKKKEEEDGENGGGEEGGIINNIISNLFHQSEGEGMAKNEAKEGKKIKGDEENQQVETEEGNGGSTGIIGNIVSRLPASIPDDAVPTADEATILINSIVRD